MFLINSIETKIRKIADRCRFVQRFKSPGIVLKWPLDDLEEIHEWVFEDESSLRNVKCKQFSSRLLGQTFFNFLVYWHHVCPSGPWIPRFSNSRESCIVSLLVNLTSKRSLGSRNRKRIEIQLNETRLISHFISTKIIHFILDKRRT